MGDDRGRTVSADERLDPATPTRRGRARSAMRGRARSAIEHVAKPGSGTRAVMRVARQMVRDGVQYSGYLRELWADAHGTASAEHAPEYRAWALEHAPSAHDLLHQGALAASRTIKTHVECIIDATGQGVVDVTLESLLSQTFPGWRATVVGSEATVRDQRVTTVEHRPLDAVIREIASEGPPHDFVVMLEAGDRLEPDFVFGIAARAWDNPFISLVQWDDDVLDETGVPVQPRFRPEWSPEMLLTANYVGRSFAVRRDRLADTGPPDLSLGDAMWWDLLFRLDLTERTVDRIPRVVHHLVRRPEVDPRQRLGVVSAHLARSGRAGQVIERPGTVQVRWDLPSLPHVTVIIPTRHNRSMLSTCLPSLARTDYPSFDVIIVDNGERTPENEAWYEREHPALDLTVRWWAKPFNYSAVNNLAAAAARGEVLVFLNDDTELVDPGWLRELVSWVRQPDIGLVGVQLLDPEGLIQHGGVVLGMHGFADHLFAGCRPGDDTPIGSTTWYRNSLSVTAACVAVDRELFDRVGGFDERFDLCGSDVTLGLDMRFLGRRNVVTPFAGVRHLESATRGSTSVVSDFPTSYWRYQKWLRGGDPYYSPNLSLRSTVPQLKPAGEPAPIVTVGGALNRDFRVFRQEASEDEARWLAHNCRADEGLRGKVIAQHEADSLPFDVRTVNWFIPDIDSPFYGGINTAFRIADQLRRHHGVRNRFVVMAAQNDAFVRSALAAAFPGLESSEIEFIQGNDPQQIAGISPADASIATLWLTAYTVAHFPHTRRRFYLIQDFEPMFYPAGTNYALAEESYRLGLYALCNTERLLDIYRSQYGGTGMSFTPAVDRSVFHPQGRRRLDHDDPVTVFLYARPGHWRNCWEIASPALAELKQRMGDGVRIVTAGSWARPDDLGRGIEHLGLLDYRDTGALYRTADIGIALTLSAHPSYLPLELMACGTPVVAFDNPAGDWILHHDENSLRCPRTVDGLADALTRLATDGALRQRLSEQGLADIAARHADWTTALEGVHGHLCDPRGQAARRR
jgi:GT2 family glycosyltransferase/glycosyltransferase involved in cell wall biosynthesis